MDESVLITFQFKPYWPWLMKFSNPEENSKGPKWVLEQEGINIFYYRTKPYQYKGL